MGSTSTAATRVGSQADSIAARSSNGTWSNPSGMGRNGLCLSDWPVAASAPSVRPWKASTVETTMNRPGPGPPAGQLDGALVGLGTGIGEEDLTAGPFGPAADQAVERGGHLRPEVVAEQVGDVAQGTRLLGDIPGHGRVGVAE